jgi:hypothetical protein
MTPVDTLGEPVTVVDTLGEPVVLINEDGTPAFLAYSAKTYLGGVAPYHWLDFIANRALYASVDVGNVTGATGYTFTRASDGYYENSDGTLTLFGSGALRRGDRGVLIEGSRTNLLTYSQEFDNGAWGKTNATITANSTAAPDGTITADTFTDNATSGLHRLITASTSWTSGTAYTASIFAKAGTSSFIQITFPTGVLSTNPYANFDVSAGTVTASGGGGTGRITALANGWYRCSLTATADGTATTGMIFYRSPDGTSTYAPSYSGSSTTIFIWQADLQAGAFPSSPIVTVAAAATRAADVLSYTVNTTAQINAAVAGQPELNTSGAPGLQGAATAATYNATTFAGAATRVDVTNQSFVVFSGFTAGAFVAVTVECLTGSVLTRQATLTSSGGSFTVINAGQTITSILPASASGTIGIASTANGTTSTFTVHSVKEVPANSLTLYPLQLWSEFERAVDTGGLERVFYVSDGTTANRAILGVSGSDLAQAESVSGGVAQSSVAAAGAVAINTVTKMAARFSTNSVQFAKNGTLGIEDTSATNPATPSEIDISRNALGSEHFGYLRRAAIIQGAGTDANLQAMTS